MAKVFISFNYDDIESQKVVLNWLKQGIGTDISFSTEEGHSYVDQGENVVRKILRKKIDESQIVLVLIGDDTHNRPWVDYEVRHALAEKKKVIWTQIPDTNGAPPVEIRRKKVTPFNMNSIRTAIRQN